MDNFLNSGYGEKSLNQERNRSTMQSVNDMSKLGHTMHSPESLDASVTHHRTVHSSLPPYMVSTSQIKPTTSFLNLGRDQQKISHYIDL